MARQNTLNGAVTVGGSYNSNVFKDDTFRKGEWKNRLAPQFTMGSLGETDKLALTYSPEYAYNFRREDDEMTHVLSALAEKGLSSRWKVKLSGNYANYDNLHFETDRNLSNAQNFLRADTVTQAEIVRLLFPELIWDPTIHMSYVLSLFQARFTGAPLSDRSQVERLLFEGSGGRQKYWNSTFEFRSEYEFASKSLFSLGYRVFKQESKTGSLPDHLEQMPSIAVAYQLNSQWRAELGYDLKIDTIDTTDDSTTNRPHLKVDFEISPRDLVFLDYTYQQITFDGARSDTNDQSADFGWRHNLDQQTTLSTSIGTAYLDRDNNPDEREYSANLGLSRKFEQGAIDFTGNVVSAVDDQTGDWEKSRRSWEVASALSYKLKQDLSSHGRISYGQWRSWTFNTQENYDQLRFGAGVSYGLNRWATLSLDYNYSLFDTAAVFLNDYTEHLVSVQLSAAKEIWRW